MIYLLVFVFGIVVDRYLLNIFDLILQSYENKHKLKACEVQLDIDRVQQEAEIDTANTTYELSVIQADIDRVCGVSDKTDDSNIIGFKMPEQHEEEMYDDEIDE